MSECYDWSSAGVGCCKNWFISMISINTNGIPEKILRNQIYIYGYGKNSSEIKLEFIFFLK